MLHLRLIFGTIFIVLLVAVFYADTQLSANWPDRAWSFPPGSLVALLAVPTIILGLREMANLLRRENVIISRRICSVAAVFCMIWPWLQLVAERMPTETRDGTMLFVRVGHFFRTELPGYVVPTVLAAALVAVVAQYSKDRRVEGAMANAGGSLLAIVYLGVLPGFFLPLVFKRGDWMFLGVLGMVKAADVGAYAVGRLVGRHKLIPWLSPGKTVEGFVGGLALAAAVGVLVAGLRNDMRWPAGLFLGLALGAVGQLGDLLESLLKRDAGVKDSGSVPGFGGILDLLDSPLLAAPVAYWLLKLLTTTPDAFGVATVASVVKAGS